MTTQINNQSDGKCGYKTFYRSKSVEVYANSSYEAQRLAAIHFRTKKQYEVTVILCEADGKTIVHNPTILG